MRAKLGAPLMLAQLATGVAAKAILRAAAGASADAVAWLAPELIASLGLDHRGPGSGGGAARFFPQLNFLSTDNLFCVQKSSIVCSHSSEFDCLQMAN